MRIFILTLGTRGDFEPFWALGRGLAARGHVVTIGTSGFHLQEDRRVHWARIGNGSREELVALLRSLSLEPDRDTRATTYGRQWVIPQWTSGREAIARLASQADYFISNLKVPLMRGGDILPGAYVSYDPPPTFASARAWGSHAHHGRTLELVAMNRALVDPDSLWEDRFHFTGFWKQIVRERRQPAALDEFVSGGTPPVTMTMGSMVTFDADALAERFSRALEISGLRGVLVTGWSDERPSADARGRLMTIPEADYEWLFARSTCVIHHGGVGTVGSVLRAGVPSVLLPQIPSQEKWGELLRRAKLCAGIFETAALDPRKLAKVLLDSARDLEMKTLAARWKSEVDRERGVAMAVELIESHWKNLGIAELPN